MPELPEVENVRRKLLRELRGQELVEASTSPAFPFPYKKIKNMKLTDIHRTGKCLEFSFNEGELYLRSKLGMTGKWLFKEESDHNHVKLVFEKNSIYYNDVRRFGSLKLAEKRLDDIDILHSGFTKNKLISKLRKRRIEIKKALLDQVVFPGSGNYIASEALFRAKLHPTVKCCDLENREMTYLFDRLKRFVSDSINAGGYSMKDFVHPDGKKGGTGEILSVYNRENKSCRKCWTKIRKLYFSDGRATYFCPECQC